MQKKIIFSFVLSCLFVGNIFAQQANTSKKTQETVKEIPKTEVKQGAKISDEEIETSTVKINPVSKITKRKKIVQRKIILNTKEERATFDKKQP